MITSYQWYGHWPAPPALAVRQVYAWIVDAAARVLLLDMPGGPNLPGGTPEIGDADWEATLRREVIEEADVTLRDVIPLGYQQVQQDQATPFAQLRATARVASWGPGRPDPDNGLIYPRCWVTLAQAPDLLGWGAPGHAQAAAVAEVASTTYGITLPTADHGAITSTTPAMQVV